VYDAAGNLKSKTDFNGKTTTYAYDTSNRLLSKTPDASFNANPITFTYFPNGLRQTMGDPSGATTYAYDNRNRLTSKVTPFGTLSYTYDAAGDLLTLKSSNTGGASDTYTYDQLNRLGTVTDASGATTYSYDAVGNLQNFTYPNGVTHAYSYDTLNRLTQVGAAKNAVGISNYAYTLGTAGNRLTVAELSGRTVNYGYDSLYRLTSENVTSDPNNHNGTTSYMYDAVGNRQQLLVNGVTANSYTYDADDRLGADSYDADGNTINSLGTANTYDFENHLLTHGGVTIVYDGDGNRVSETIGGVTTNYLVDTQNPTGYAQVVDELQAAAVARTYSYGLERISESQTLNSVLTTSFYGYDGHGSVRQLTNSAGSLTDTYDYDPFGNLVNQTGTTPNNYRFAGEPYDPALNLYYNRARYLNTITGRFWSVDDDEGDDDSPLSLHKYTYAENNPTNNLDPSGNEVDALGAFAVSATMDSMSALNFSAIAAAVNGAVNKVPLSGHDYRNWVKWSFQATQDVYNADCSCFLSAHGLSADSVAFAILMQQAYDGTKSKITKFNAGIYSNALPSARAAQFASLQITVQQDFQQNQNMLAEAQAAGVSRTDAYFRPGAFDKITIEHESLHNLTGLDDDDLASQLGWGGGGNPSVFISNQLRQNRCDKLKAKRKR
jgi:RHS repeat-associated protein